ncbi:MAG: polysaccharide deacetylase family protein [Saprospiraceae bacterium]
MKKLPHSDNSLLISHLFVASLEQNSRISFVINTICEWYGWQWSYSNDDLPAGALCVSYALPSRNTRAFKIEPRFPIAEIGKQGTQAHWGDFREVPNPCASDPIAGIFYLLTCAEEYTIANKDKHGRVRAIDLSVVKNGYSSIPLADRLAQVLAKAIWKTAGREGTPEMKLESGYSSLDIDQVYALRYKPFYKKLANLGRSVLTNNWKASQAVTKAIFGGKDPFDQFEWIKELHASRGLKPFVFLLMGYENETDPAWNPNHPQWPGFIERIESWTQLGVHPSYRASIDEQMLQTEKRSLEDLLGEPVHRSRQHFLRVSWPETFQSLVRSGITEDFTLAWADWLGFRMGTARSCFWYDLTTDKQTNLRLYPPSMMEVTGRYYLGLSPKQFLQKAGELNKEAKRSNSGLRVLWHNSSLSDVGRWGSWRGIYPEVLDLVAD